MMEFLSFKEFINNLSEGTIALTPKSFSFSEWLAESEQEFPDIRPMVRSMSDKEAIDKAELIMGLVKQKLFTHFPIWRPFWSKMPPICSIGAGDTGPDGIGTMCTTGTAIFYDPRFVVMSYEVAKRKFFPNGGVPNALQAIREGLRHPIDYSLFVIIHEILHCSLKHHLRFPVPSTELSRSEIARLWNLAADYAINHILLSDPRADLYEFFPGGVRADEGGFAVEPEDREFFMNSSAERIFNRLLLNLEEKRRKQKEEQEKEKGDEGEEGESGEDSGESGEGGQSGQQGQPGESGEGGEGGEGGEQGPLTPGEVIYDKETGEYGVVTSVEGEEIEYEPISEEEARQRLKR